MLDTGLARTFVQGLEELFGQVQVGFHPALAGCMGQVQVEPEKGLGCRRLLQMLQGTGRVDLLTTSLGRNRKPYSRPKRYESWWLWSMLWFMQVRRREGIAAVSSSLQADLTVP